MPTLNFVIAIIIGFVIGLLTELLMEILYFRGWRKQVRDDRITQLQTDLAACDEHLAQLQVDLEARDARIVDLESRLARGQERLNTLQREAALQRQRVQAAVIDEQAEVPPPIGDVTDPGSATESVAEAVQVVDAWADADDESPPTTWLD